MNLNDGFLKNNYRLTQALLISLLVHLFFVFGLKLSSSSTAPKPVEIIFMPGTKSPKQIVSPPQIEPSAVPVDSNLLSDKNAFTKIETIKRGIEDAGTPTTTTPVPPAPQKSAPVKKPSSPPQKIKAEQKPDTTQPPTLRLAPSEIDASFSASKKTPSTQSKQTNEERTLSDPDRESHFRSSTPFRTYSLPGTQLGERGFSDFLPTIRDGDLTLLNTKADQYAVFVRRVALQVFGSLRKHNWQNVSRGEVRRIENYAVVEAIMSKEGKLIRTELLRSSGSALFDRSLTDAVKEGAWDQNPPAGSETVDGNIHFHFQARTWSQLAPNNPNEQRWIRLGTGLK